MISYIGVKLIFPKVPFREWAASKAFSTFFASMEVPKTAKHHRTFETFFMDSQMQTKRQEHQTVPYELFIAISNKLPKENLQIAKANYPNSMEKLFNEKNSVRTINTRFGQEQYR